MTEATLTIEDHRSIPVDDVAPQFAPIHSVRFIISSTPRLFRTRLGKVRATDFEQAFDYLHVGSLAEIPSGTSFRGYLSLVINDTLEKRFELPRHYIGKVTQVIVPLNPRAVDLMKEFRLFNPEASKLTYHDMDAVAAPLNPPPSNSGLHQKSNQ